VARVTVAVACRRAAEGSTRFSLKPMKPLTVRVAPSSHREVRLTCPQGLFPAAAGFDLGPALAMESQTQTFHAFVFRVRNRGSAARTVSLHGGCLTVLRPAGSSTRLQVRLTSDTVPVDPGANAVRRRCPTGWLALGAGYSLRPGLELEGAAAALREARWSVTSTAAGQLPATFELVCSRLSG
jgi:hypothetical protein